MTHPSNEEPRIFTELTPDEDGLEVWLDGELVEIYTYDDIGSAGFSAINRLVEKLQSQL
jgi:hypothetical protein